MNGLTIVALLIGLGVGVVWGERREQARQRARDAMRSHKRSIGLHTDMTPDEIAARRRLHR